MLFALALASLAMPRAARAETDPSSDVAVKAAFLYNFAKFTDWQALAPTAPVTMCVVGDPRVAAALVETVRGQHSGGHPLEVKAMGGDGQMRECKVLFISIAEARRSTDALDSIRQLPVLTVSEATNFSRTGGIVEFFVEDNRLRFYVNTNAADRSGLHLSSRLLGLARIVHDDHVE